MGKDVEQLFRNINQANIPYREFDPPTVPSPALGYDQPEREVTTWEPNSELGAPKSRVFRKFVGDAQPQTPAGTPLESIFERMREKRRPAKV